MMLIEDRFAGKLYGRNTIMSSDTEIDVAVYLNFPESDEKKGLNIEIIVDCSKECDSRNDDMRKRAYGEFSIDVTDKIDVLFSDSYSYVVDILLENTQRQKVICDIDRFVKNTRIFIASNHDISPIIDNMIANKHKFGREAGKLSILINDVEHSNSLLTAIESLGVDYVINDTYYDILNAYKERINTITGCDSYINITDSVDDGTIMKLTFLLPKEGVDYVYQMVKAVDETAEYTPIEYMSMLRALQFDTIIVQKNFIKVIDLLVLTNIKCGILIYTDRNLPNAIDYRELGIQ